MIFRNAKLILVTDLAITLFSVVTSLIGARALGPAGRGDLLLITLWPIVIAMMIEVGLPNAYRYWMAKDPARVSALFTNAIIYTLVLGAISFALGDILIPRLIGQRTDEVMFLVRVYMINIPGVVLLSLMRGLLEGTRRFGWSGAARFTFFVVQATGFAILWFAGHMTVATATLTMMAAQTVAMTLAIAAVLRELKPRWQPSWREFKTSMSYGLRDYAGVLADYTTLRVDQLMLGATAANAAVGLYVVAVRLSEMTTFVAGAAADALMPEVARSGKDDEPEALLARMLRLTMYLNLIVLVPLWLLAPTMLRILFGPSFVEATSAFRWLLVAAIAWSASSIVIRGLQGFGYPGLTTIARFFSAGVSVVALIILLPRMGITGAAISSLIGYTVLFGVSLVALIQRRRLTFWHYVRPRRHDIPMAQLRSLANLNLLTARSTEG